MNQNPPPAPITPENPTGQSRPENKISFRLEQKRKPASPLFILLILALFLFRFTMDNLRPHSSPVTVPVTPVSPGTATSAPDLWKTYTDEMKTYQISTPADWEWITPATMYHIENNFIQFKASDGSVLQVFPYEMENQSLTVWIQKHDQSDSTSWEGRPSKKVLSSKSVFIGPYSGVEREEEWLAAGYTTLVSYTRIGNSVYEFSIQPGSVPYRKSEVYGYYHRILASFRLLSPTPTR